jgi:hypothetical protein
MPAFYETTGTTSASNTVTLDRFLLHLAGLSRQFQLMLQMPVASTLMSA